MSHLTVAQHELVAIGASLASNCIPCIKFHVQRGREAGLDDELIREALEVADMVRQVPARKVLEAATASLASDRAPSRDSQGKSPCERRDDARISRSTVGSPCCGPETGPT